MRFIWNEAKRRANLQDHEIDFVDAERVFSGQQLSKTPASPMMSNALSPLGYWTECRFQSFIRNPSKKFA